MEIKYYLPKIKELHIYNYDLYKCPVDIKFSPKLNLVFGTNGLGKTTLLNILQYSIIGPYTGKVKSRNWKDQQKLKRPMLDKNYFRNRMSNQNQQAEVKVVYSLGDDLYEVWHSLYEYKANVIKEFNQRFPQYKDELKVFSSNNDELTFAFHGINHITTLSKLNHDYGLENWKDDELLWLNITNLFDHITSVYERIGEAGLSHHSCG